MVAADSYSSHPFSTGGETYKSLFENSPLPMWFYDLDTLRFLAVNDAAVHRYGYSRAEFLDMTVNDLRPHEEEDQGARTSEVGTVVREWRGWRHRLKSGEVIEVEITTQGVRYEGHKAAFVIINGMQNRIPQKPPAEAADDSQAFRLAFEKSAVPAILFDSESGEIKHANLSAASFYGDAAEKLYSLKVTELFLTPAGEDADSLRWLMAGREDAPARASFRFARGGTRDVDIRCVEISHDDKQLVHMTVTEVAEEPAVEDEKSKDDTYVRDLLNLASEGYYLRTGDGVFMEVNPAFAAMLGYTREELLTGNMGASVYVDAPHSDVPMVGTGADTGTEVYQMRKKDGTKIWVEDHSQFIWSGDGDVVHREGLCRDVTREKTEQMTEGRFDSVMRGLSDMVLVARRSDGRIIEANEAAAMAHRYTRREMQGKTIFDLRATDAPGTVQEQMNVAENEGLVFETMHRRRDGSIFPVETRLQRMYLDNEEVLVSVSRDTTSRKLVDARLKQSEEKYRTIFERSPMGILYFDFNGVVTDCNDSLAAIMGSSRKSIIGLRLLELPSKEFVGAVRNVLEGKLVEYKGNYRSFTASKTIHVRTTFTPISASGGRPAGGMAIFEDITERDKADTALRESEKRYRLLYEDSPVPYHLLDSNGKITDVNKSWADLLGFTKQDALGRDFSEFVAREQLNDFAASIQSFKSIGTLGNLELDLLCKGGERVTVAVEGKLVRGDDGAILQSQFMLYDITERRMAENALRESEQKFRSLAESASSAIFMYQKDRICYANDACAAVTGYDRDELLEKNFWEVVHPDFRDLVKELGVRRQRGEPVPNHYELKIRTKSGESKWIDFTGATAQFKGELAVLGTVYDATDLKEVQTKLEESEEQHNILVETSPDAIMIFTEGKLVYLNPVSLRTLRADSEDRYYGKPLSGIFAPDSRGEIAEALDRIHKTLKPVELRKCKVVRADGSNFEANVVAASVAYLGRASVQFIIRDRMGRLDVAEKPFSHDVALSTISNAVAVTGRDFAIKWANPAFETLTGYSVSEALGKDVFEVGRSGDHDNSLFQQIRSTVLSGGSWYGEVARRRKDGKRYTESLVITPVKDEKNAVSDLVFVKQDNTLRESFEEQLLKAKKLEGIGQIVGAVVHDYNDIFSVILGYAELLKKTLKDHDPLRLSAEAILSSTRKAADLTKQLLDFEQEGIVSPKSVDVNKAILTMEGTFRRTLGDDLKMHFTPTPGLWDARIDPIHLYEILVNLAANAREAILDGGGTLEVKASNVMVEESFAAKHGGFAPGEYVMISFSDTGKGIDNSLLGRIFEPFVTTKHEEHVAGLGLAAVYGMVKRSGGGITVRSTPGEGTTFCVYVPRGDEENAQPVETIVPVEALQSDKTVLLVEDQADLLNLMKQTLEGYGYKSVAALGPEEALDICESYPEEIHVMLSDVVLPGINGAELSEKVLAMRPNIKVVFMSGYSAETLTPKGMLNNAAEFLQKPFTADELARKLYNAFSSGR